MIYLKSINIDILKIFAILLMFIDHMNNKFLDINILFLIGRIAFPIFAFLLVYNYLFNSNHKSIYIKRLFILGIISQIPFYFYFDNIQLNILFTLGISLSIIHYILETNKSNIEKIGVVGLLSLILYIFPFFEYDLIGFLGILSLYYSFKFKEPLLLLPIIFSNGFTIPEIVFTSLSLFIIYLISFMNFKFSLNRKIIGKVFYLFYPLHILILYIFYIVF